MYHTNRQGGNNTHHCSSRQQPGGRQSTAHHILILQSATFSRAVPTPSKAWRKRITKEQRLTIGDTEKNNATMEQEMHVFPMLIYVMLHLERRRRRRWVGEDTGDACMDVVEVSASEVCLMLGVVMLVVDVDAVHAGVSVDGIVKEVEEEEEGRQWRQWMWLCLQLSGDCVSACGMKCGACV
ncbi:hypothetical protein NDU88_001104 [Pleurodeles waltl]|uniref:Uncharacterized protein n=1 Tax=Pleurodeles waltl TaxID=8319 RepID=A0AAV7SYH5_PLEWA|nr:hypothetical protein NDU88_001104 [Pleurodeles waltl]